MKAPRVFVDLLGSADRKNTLLTAEQAHHLKDVLRLAAGDPVIVVDRHSARSYHGTIGSLDPHISVIIGAELTIGNRLQPVQTLLFGLSKGQKNELVCEKATELGVELIIFYQANRSVAKISSNKLERLRRIAESASEQSGKDRIPEVLSAPSLEQAILLCDSRTSGNDHRLYCSLASGAGKIRDIKCRFGRVHLVVGPEGDFSPQEEESLRLNCFEPVSLGPYVLRSETAAIAAIAMAQVLFEVSNGK